MLAYLATKEQFLDEAPEIQDRVREAVRDRLGIDIAVGSAEYASWQNSLGNAMFHAIAGSSIPDQAGVAVEYRLHGRGRRIDFLLSGYDGNRGAHLAIVELKQWTDVGASPLQDHVRTFVGGGSRDAPHPSYQAWSYGQLMQDFYEVVVETPIDIAACAYAHNCVDPSVLRSPAFESWLVEAPIYLKGERRDLAQFLGRNISIGDGGDVLRRLDSSRIRPARQLVEALRSMLDGNDEFVLIDEQKTAFERIVERVKQVDALGKGVLVVEGGPGTGKSVIAVNALVRLLGEGLDARYVTKNAAPRAVYRKKLEGTRSKRDLANLFLSSDTFRSVPENELDVALVDEAHRLVRQGGLYGNLGENQIDEIINAARVSVFFLDEGQHVTWRDFGSRDEVTEGANRAGVAVQYLTLAAQFRCSGSDEYIEWVDALFGFGAPVQEGQLTPMEYEVIVFDDPEEMREAIVAKNDAVGSSRLLAGYCWNWESRNDPSHFDITFPGTGFAMKWNLTEHGSGWIMNADSISEVGCIHTCQGLEGAYMGVIIGPDLVVREGVLCGNPDARARSDKSLKGFKKALKVGEPNALGKAERLVRTTYRTLLTRGMRGTFIYCTDPTVADLLRSHLPTTVSGNG